MPPDVWLLPYLRAAQSGDPNELNKYWVRWRELECKNFEILFKNYEIDPNSPSAWRLLATRLAREYVRGFQLADKQRGRPSKPKPKTLSKPGAPIKWSREHYEILIELHRKGEELLSEKNDERITQVAAMTAGASWIVEQEKLDWSKEKIRRVARAWTKRLSEAKKIVRKPQNK